MAHQQMDRHREWPLVFFTLLTQLAVGLFVLWGFSAVAFPIFGSGSEFVSVAQPVLVTALGALMVGALAAGFHLGRPAGAFFSISAWQRSWLSREALFSIGFGGDVALVLALDFLGFKGSLVELAAVAAGASLGFGLIASISRLYQLRTVPAWNHAGTPAAFVTTSLLTGAAALMVILQLGWSGIAQVAEFTVQANRLIILLVVVQAVIFSGSMIYLSNQGRTGLESVRLLGTKLRLPLAVRWITAGAGLLLLVFGTSAWLYVSAYGLLLVSEVFGRFLFYGIYQRSGL